MATETLAYVFTSLPAQTEPVLYPHAELLAEELLQLFLPRRGCIILPAGTSQRRSSGLFISTLLAKGLAPTRNLQPGDCDIALCPNVFLDIGELNSAGGCTQFSQGSQVIPHVRAEQNVSWGVKETTLLSHYRSFSQVCQSSAFVLNNSNQMHSSKRF